MTSQLSLSRRTGTPRARAAALAAAAVTGALALSGCAPTETGAAAIIDGHRLALSTVQDRVATVVKAQGKGAEPDATGELQRRQIMLAISEQVYRQVAAAKDVKVTSGEVDSYVDQVLKENGGRKALEAQAVSSGYTPGQLRQVLTLDVLQQKLAAAYGATEQGSKEAEQLNSDIEDAASQMDVTVNPRYGRWDPQKLEIVAPKGTSKG